MTSIPASKGPLEDEEPDDDDHSSDYGKTIKRIIQRAQSIPSNRLLVHPPPSFFNQNQRVSLLNSPRLRAPHLDRISITLSHDRQSFDAVGVENRSTYSFNDYPSSFMNYNTDVGSQYETSFMGDDNIEISSITENNTFDLFSAAPKQRGLLNSNRAQALYQRRCQSRSVDGNINYRERRQQQDFESELADDQESSSSEDSQPDLNTIWSWKNLKREFRLTQSENLFHLYQAKLQHSFFVALLILNIIFYTGAIVTHFLSQHIVDRCK